MVLLSILKYPDFLLLILRPKALIRLCLYVLLSLVEQHTIIIIIQVFQDTGQCPSNPSSSTLVKCFKTQSIAKINKKGEKINFCFTPVVTLKCCVANNMGFEVTVKHLDYIYELCSNCLVP